MLGYRLYFLDADGHIQHAVEFESESDEEALRSVESLRDECDLELWTGARVVARLTRRQDA